MVFYQLVQAIVPSGCFLVMVNDTDGANEQPLHAADYDFNDALLSIRAEFWVELVLHRLPSNKD